MNVRVSAESEDVTDSGRNFSSFKKSEIEQSTKTICINQSYFFSISFQVKSKFYFVE